MAGVAGANIANAAGRPDAAGDPISAAVVQDPIGAYVQDADNPTANTNYAGVNTDNSWSYDPTGEGVNPVFTCVGTCGAAAGKRCQIVQASEAIAFEDDVAITLGSAAVDNSTGTHTCLVADGVPDGEFFWPVEK